MTSIEWLIEQIKSTEWKDKYIWHKEDVFEQAKEMHKQEIIDAYDKNKMGRVNYGEQYYQETFKKD
jgi:hypothetical protein